jgi:hypothetical protein
MCTVVGWDTVVQRSNWVNILYEYAPSQNFEVTPLARRSALLRMKPPAGVRCLMYRTSSVVSLAPPISRHGKLFSVGDRRLKVVVK